MQENARTDRYQSFCGIECDANANQLIAHLQDCLAKRPEQDLWRQYFDQKFEQQTKLNHDNLFYVGSQLNNLYAFFEEIDDEPALAMLWQLEIDCC